MSTTAAMDMDFWDYVCCSRCYLPVSTDKGSFTIPFWLTECGHVVCNNHLKSDQSCATCGATQIQVTPLQHDLEAPMSEWFRSVPSALDAAAFAAKFQQETLASQIRFYKSKYHRQKMLSDQLKKANEALAAENAQLHQRFQDTQQQQYYEEAPSHIPNINGKRPMVGNRPRQFERPGSQASSGTNLSAPGAPERLTIPAMQPPRPLHNDQVSPHGPSVSLFTGHQSSQSNQSDRPGTSGFQHRFAFQPQQASIRLQQTPKIQDGLSTMQPNSMSPNHQRSSMAPPQMPVQNRSMRQQPQRQLQASDTQAVPPTASHPSKRAPNNFLQPLGSIHSAANEQGRRPRPQHNFIPPRPPGGSHRSVPPTPQHHQHGVAFPGTSQRKPFVPQEQHATR
ncbi:hypothetical protein DL96DRAFT_1680937 [Flagelloscypha sp. PMI_526]|nr:hypothetical protein DL96DRAFT_1680937 [Flagelloscypha sp. PMI_526]